MFADDTVYVNDDARKELNMRTVTECLNKANMAANESKRDFFICVANSHQKDVKSLGTMIHDDFSYSKKSGWSAFHTSKKKIPVIFACSSSQKLRFCIAKVRPTIAYNCEASLKSPKEMVALQKIENENKQIKMGK